MPVAEKTLKFLGRYDPLKNQMVRILSEDGTCDDRLRPDLQDEELRLLYRHMVFARLMDRKAVSLQRQGRIGTYGQLEGQEAAQVGSAYALTKQDWIVPSYREAAAMLVHGVPISLLCTYWVGSEEGNKIPEDVRCLPIAIPVGSQPLHAVGIAWAAKLRREPSAAIAYFGDGASSQGDVHEAMNFAAVFNVPCVFFCQNNHYAISVHRSRQAAAPTLAQRGIAYGMPGIQIDGNDIFASYAVTKEAVDRARAGGGPCFIEAVTYRIGAHTTADDPSRYRDAREVEEWRKRDPIDRLRRHLETRKLWSEDREQKLRDEVSAEIEAAIEVAEKQPPPKAEDVFRHMFAEMTPQLREQEAWLKAALKSETRS
jgi:pyruvate dehydrogenase E1 component alpha subunit